MSNAGLGLHLDSVQQRHPEQLAQGPTFIGNNIVHPTAKIGNDCQIGPDVSIGLECVIGDGVRISNSVLLHRVKVRPIWLRPIAEECVMFHGKWCTLSFSLRQSFVGCMRTFPLYGMSYHMNVVCPKRQWRDSNIQQ